MSRRTIGIVVNTLLVLAAAATLSAQTGTPLFREIWKQVPKGGENPASAEHLWNPKLTMTLVGEEADAQGPEAGLKITGDRRDTNPIHTWSGVCPASCGLLLKHNDMMVDLSRGHITMNIKASGLHKVRPLVKLADGRMFIAVEGAGSFTDWSRHNWIMRDQSWFLVDPNGMVTRGTETTDVDLSQVDEIGYLDLMPGSGHGAGGWTDVAEIEVYGTAVPR